MFWSHFDWKIRVYHRYWRESKDEIFALRTLVVSAAVTKVGCLRNAVRKYSVDPDRALYPLPPRIIWAMGAKPPCLPSCDSKLAARIRNVTTAGLPAYA